MGTGERRAVLSEFVSSIDGQPLLEVPDDKCVHCIFRDVDCVTEEPGLYCVDGKNIIFMTPADYVALKLEMPP